MQLKICGQPKMLVKWSVRTWMGAIWWTCAFGQYKQSGQHTARSALQLHSRMHWIHCSISSSEGAAISRAVGCVGEIMRNTNGLSPRPPGSRSTTKYPFKNPQRQRLCNMQVSF